MRRAPRAAHVIAVVAALAAPTGALAQRASRAAPAYQVVRRIEVGGEGGWDYLTVDTAAHRLYVARGSHVMVLDTDLGMVVGDIPHTPGVHGVALARELGRGFTSNGGDSTVTAFDLRTLALIRRVNVGARNPDAILYEPDSRRVFAFNGGSASATAIDAATLAVVGSVRLGGKPEFAVHDGAGRVFVNIEDRSEIVAFDARTLAVLARWRLAPCEGPTGLAIDRAHGRLFSGCSNSRMAVVDARSGRIVATLPVGSGVDGTAFDPKTALAFSSNGGDGTITMVREDSPDRFVVVGTAATQRGARTIALDERTHRLYTASARLGAAPAAGRRGRARSRAVPGSFTILVLER